MRIVFASPPRTSLAAAALVLLFGSAPLLAAVVERDLGQQLDFVNAHVDGRVVYGEILSSQSVDIPAFPDLPFTRLTVSVQQDLLSAGSSTETLVVFVPGADQYRLSISPPEAELRVGESILFFMRQQQELTDYEAGSYKVDSFAETFRTQLNRKGEVIVLGEGSGSAVPKNTKLDDLARNARTIVAARKAEKK